MNCGGKRLAMPLWRRDDFCPHDIRSLIPISENIA
jgi:hypothetical protein